MSRGDLPFTIPHWGRAPNPSCHSFKIGDERPCQQDLFLTDCEAQGQGTLKGILTDGHCCNVIQQQEIWLNGTLSWHNFVKGCLTPLQCHLDTGRLMQASGCLHGIPSFPLTRNSFMCALRIDNSRNDTSDKKDATYMQITITRNN